MNSLFTCLAGPMSFVLLLFAEHAMAKEPVCGRVLCGGRGVPGVVVTDGERFTQTDSHGAYRLVCGENAMHVYISVPAGYTVPVAESVPMFWIRVDTLAVREGIDFTLLREPDKGRRHRFVAMGDPQVRNRRELSQLDSLLAALKRTVAQLPASSEIPVLVAGDIVFNRPKMHLPSKKSFAVLGRPVFYAIGNHDHGPIRDSKTPANEEPATRRFREHYGPTYYSTEGAYITSYWITSVFGAENAMLTTSVSVRSSSHGSSATSPTSRKNAPLSFWYTLPCKAGNSPIRSITATVPPCWRCWTDMPACRSSPDIRTATAWRLLRVE